jgi:hypothetical protein
MTRIVCVVLLAAITAAAQAATINRINSEEGDEEMLLF